MKNKSTIPIFSPYVSPRAVKFAAEVLSSGYIGQGRVVKQFEQKLKSKLGVYNPVAVNSGTSALYLALALAGVGSGDEVITTPQTFMATSHVILALGARPVFTDIQYYTGNMDPQDIEHRITEKTKAIMPVHWAGYPCDMGQINRLADKYDLPVIEDAAQALGAHYKGKPIGAVSSYTCFSFQAVKQITSVDGGMLCVKDKTKYREAVRRRWFGIDRERRKPHILGEPAWNVKEIGYKFHMNDVLAAVGLKNFEEFDKIHKHLNRISQIYRKGLNKIPGISLFEDKPDRASGYWVFCMHVKKRVGFIKAMNKRGIGASVVHLRIDRNDIFGPVRKGLPNLERFTRTMVCLPLHYKVSVKDAGYIVRSIKKGW